MAKEKEMDQLTKDSISAQKAGMSYGQYMAMRYAPNGAKQKESVDDDQKYYCAICGKPIPNYRTGKKYCCQKCYEIAVSEKHRERYIRKVNQNES